MTHDWLLVETLGNEPAVVAQGHHVKNLVPISAFLRRNPNLAAIGTAIAESVQTGQGLASITSKRDRVIRTEPVQMSDGRVHGVHVWSGPADAEPPERSVPGPLTWNLTLGAATDTPQSLANRGKNPETEATDGRAFAEYLPSRDLKPEESAVIASIIRAEPGHTICSVWDNTDWQGNPIRVGFVARNCLEPGLGGHEHLITRAMNWRTELEVPAAAGEDLAQRILTASAQPGVHRALVDLNNWSLLKWLDEPYPFYDWRGSDAHLPRAHPDDASLVASMTTQLADGPTTRVLRLPGHDGAWVPVHVTVNRVELDENTFAGLVSLRTPTDDELTGAGFSTTDKPAS